jgi:type II secretory pathway component PulF
LEEALQEGSELYELQAEREAQLIQSVLPPLLIFLVAPAIGFVTMGLFLPVITILEHL